MVSKKSAGHVVSIVSATTAPAVSSTIHAEKCSILRSAFSPSRFQLSLFASVIQGLDAQQLRIHDTISGRLRNEHAVGSAKITCLDWGHYGSSHRSPDDQPSRKRRKKEDETNGTSTDQNDIVLAFGTNHAEIHLFSPTESKVLQVLKNGNTQAIRDFRFAENGEAWSLGSDGKLVQWNLRTGKSIRTIPSPSTTAATLLLPIHSSILCASSNITYLINATAKGKPREFSASTNAIHHLLASPSKSSEPPSSFLAAAESDRYVNVFDIKHGLTGSLIAGSDVETIASLDYRTDESKDDSPTLVVLATVTKQGEVEIFPSPFDFNSSAKSDQPGSLKTKKNQRTRHATAFVRVTRPNKPNVAVPILSASFDDDDLVVAWTEGGVQLNFERLPWRNAQTGEVSLTGMNLITKSKGAAGLEATTMNGVKDLGRSRVNESHVVVAKGGDAEDNSITTGAAHVIEISSAEEEEADSESESESEDDRAFKAIPSAKPHVNGVANGDTEMEDAMSDGIQDAENNAASMAGEEPSFGDRIRANAIDTVDVAAAFTNPEEQAIIPHGDGALKLPSGMSLGTVLAQSLRTNDVALLESCFHVHDLDIIRATIERLDSSLAAALLQKLAERLHSRPGRAGSLMVWIQWTLIAHGGYLATQPEAMKRLASLHRVVKERANSLQPLLSLKGKLDMLEAQMNLRRSMQTRYGIEDAGNDDDDERVIYVEGQEDSSSESEGEDDSSDSPTTAADRRALMQNGTLSSSEEDDDDMDEMPTTRGIGAGENDEEDSESGGEGMFDDEASESDDDGSDEEMFDGEVDHDDVDTGGEDEEESEAEAPRGKQAGRPKLSNGLSSRRK